MADRRRGILNQPIFQLPSSVIKSLISDLITALSSESQRLLRLGRQRAGHAQTLGALIAQERVTRFRSEHAVDFSAVVTCSRQLVLNVGHRYGGGLIIRT